MKTDMTDTEVQCEINRIEQAIEQWVKAHDLWGDCCFLDYIDSVDAEPWHDHPVVTIFASDGEFNRIFEGAEEELYDSFSTMLESNGYWFERDTGRIYVLSEDEHMNRIFKEYFHWKWICSLLKPDFCDIHHELFRYFENDPARLLKLNWRQFEILVYELLRNQGFTVELGPGGADGGIDITMLQTDPIGDILTAVQVKRYRPDRKIDLQAVQALHGGAVADGMAKSAFVTTSAYSPSAERFASRENVTMDLYLASDVMAWCRHSHRGIIQDKAKLISRQCVEKTLMSARQRPCDYIVHASTGCTVTMNSYAIKLKETKNAALLMELPKCMTSHDGHETRGYEIPELEDSIVLNALNKQGPFGPGKVVRAKKNRKDGGCFWTGSELYSVWTGEPMWFDVMD